ncbi:hypothetical protein OR263_11380 [Streptomyces sp. NEAU-H22]|uniref:hypothetical protein n=1 Tax=Streptomyces sp. NEAU-H22 TaxID=2994655 RepID=UPI002252AB08|nr:hypothetical protein [Streptomyces sp. NEAU-H22]MCX3287306.1 hypothetical protein [Streptomyces sp. NEAU-H22]
MHDPVLTEVSKVRLADPEDRRWHWVSRALARHLGMSDWQLDQEFVAGRYTEGLEPLRRGGKYAVVVCLDESECTAAHAELLAAVADVDSSLLGGVVVLRAVDDAMPTWVSACSVPDSPYADKLAGFAPQGRCAIVPKAEQAPPGPAGPVTPPTPPLVSSDVVQGQVWVQWEHGGVPPGPVDFYEGPGGDTSLSPGDWVVTVMAGDALTDPAAVAARRVGEVEGEASTATVVFDRVWVFPAPVAVPAAGGEEAARGLCGLAPGGLESLLPPSGLAGLAQAAPSVRGLHARDIAAEANAHALMTASRCVAVLRAGRHLIIRGGAGRGRTTLALALLRQARARGLCSATRVIPGTEEAHEAMWSSSSSPFDYRPPGVAPFGATTATTALHQAIGEAYHSGAWCLVDLLGTTSVPRLAAGLSAVRVRQNTERIDHPSPWPDAVPERGPWRLVVTTSMSPAALAQALGDDLLYEFGVVDLDRPPGGPPGDGMTDPSAPAWAELTRRLAALDAPAGLMTPGKLSAVAGLAAENIRTAAQADVMLVADHAFLLAAESLLLPGALAAGEEVWRTIEKGLLGDLLP